MKIFDIMNIGQISFLLLLIPRFSILTNARFRDYKILPDSVEKPRINNRISGGFGASEGDLHSFVGLKGVDTVHDGYEVYCGGVLIAKDLILTAGQCFNADTKHFKIYAAPSIFHPDLWEEKGVKTYEVEQACRSEKYAIPKAISDIPRHDYQILSLKRPILGVNETLLASSQIELGALAVGAGIGLVEGKSHKLSSTNPQVLQIFNAYKVECDDGYNLNVCFRSVTGSTCSADEGSPIYYEPASGPPVVVGIASSVTTNCGPDHTEQSLYTDVSKILDDIKRLARKCSIRYERGRK